MNTNTIITDKFVFGGNCIGKINGKTVFVPYSLPGEELEIEITESFRDYDNAKIKKILKASPYRIKPVCPYYEKCGGCNMMHIESSYQKELRKEIFRDLFDKNGISLDKIEIISGSDNGYRSRIQLNNGCFSEKKSNNLIPINNCPIADKNINDWLSKIPANERPEGRIHIFAHDNLKEKIIVSRDLSEEKNKSQNYSELKKKNKNIKQIRKFYSGTQLSLENEANLTLLGKNLSFDVRGFFQSNIEVFEKSIVEAVKDLVGNSVLDMYAGCGTFSLFLADYFKNVTLVEHNRDALVYAEKNLTGKNHVSIGLSGAKWAMQNPSEHFDAVVIDPPRSGMEKEVLNYLCKSEIPQIRAVSCNPSTQARDISRLVKAGYKIQKAFLLDFYPNTSHIESLINLVKE